LKIFFNEIFVLSNVLASYLDLGPLLFPEIIYAVSMMIYSWDLLV